MCIPLRYTVILACLFFAETSCSISKKNNDRDKPLEVDIDWDKECSVHAIDIGFKEAWCLTSTSGMEDAGQFFIYAHDDNKSAQLDYVKRGAPTRVPAPFDYIKTITESKRIDGAQWTKLKAKLISADALKDFDGGSFDGVKYTFRHLVPTEGEGHANKTLTSKTSIEINNPETDKVKAKKHLELIQTIEKAATP